MNAFSYKDGELCCEQMALRRLAEQYGTPLYVYSQGHIVGQYRALDAAFASLPHLVCFAVKANSNLGVLRVLASAGAGFDIVSQGELYRVVQAGGDAGKCVFSGVGKTREEIEYALKLGIYSFNVESEPELELIHKVATDLRRRAPIALRVNPGVDPDTHHYISTGKHESKFGIAVDRAEQVYAAANKLSGVEIRGIQMHIGSQIVSARPFVQAVRKLVPLIEQLKRMVPETFRFFGVGGGLGIRYRKEEPPTAVQYAAALKPYLAKLGLQTVLEPGRFIVGNGGVLVTRVTYVKRTPVKRFVITDAAMNDLIRPALYDSFHEIVPVKEARAGAKTMVADIVGPVCETGDFFALGRRLPVVAAGDLLAIRGAGAYGMVMASNYNTRPRPAEVMVDGRRYEVVRQRESLKDLVDGEQVAQWQL